MVTDPYEIILPLLREIRAEIGAVRQKQSDHDKQLLHIDRQLTATKRDMAEIYEVLSDHRAHRLSVEERLSRIERQIGLTETLTQ